MEKQMEKEMEAGFSKGYVGIVCRGLDLRTRYYHAMQELLYDGGLSEDAVGVYSCLPY